MSNNKSVIVSGPAACGKTRNAKRIARALGLPFIADGSYGTDLSALPAFGTLCLTVIDPGYLTGIGGTRILAYAQAMLIVEGYEKAHRDMLDKKEQA